MRRHIGIIGASAALALLTPGIATAATTPVPTATGSATATTSPTAGTSTSTGAASATSSPSPSATPSTSTPSPSTTASTSATAQAQSTAGLVAGGTSRLAAPAAAGPTTSTDPAEVAAGFIARQLAAQGGYLMQSGFPDLGLTIDAILALDAAGVGAAQANASTQYVADHINEYIGPAFGSTELYAGALGKAIVLATAQGADPRNFGGVDLVASLQSLEGADGGFHDKSQYGDFANTIGMTFDLIGLKRAGVDPTTNNLAWLLTHQCTDGGFAVTVTSGQPCVSDPDATAYAVQALYAVQGSSPATDRALNYLASKQGADGGFAAAQAGPNTNTTGLAGQAFLVADQIDNASAAADFVLGFELGCTYAAPMRGGIAFDEADLTAADTATTPSDQMVRATPQAVLAMAGVALLDISVEGAVSNAPVLPCVATTSPTSSAPVTTKDPSTTVAPVGVTGSSQTGGTLAYTGADAPHALLLAVALIVIGAALVLLTRTRRQGRHA